MAVGCDDGRGGSGAGGQADYSESSGLFCGKNGHKKKDLLPEGISLKGRDDKIRTCGPTPPRRKSP